MSTPMIVGVRLNPANVPQTVINKVVSDEYRARYERARKREARIRREVIRSYEPMEARMAFLEKTCSRLFAQRAAEMHKRRRKSLPRRILNAVDSAWAMAWSMFICYSEALHLIVDERNE